MEEVRFQILGGRGDPLKKRIFTHNAPLPFFSYCLCIPANNPRTGKGSAGG